MNRKHIVALIALALLLFVALLTVFFGTWLWSLAGGRALQALGDWLTPPMRILTFLGDNLFYLIAMPLVYWCIHKGLGADLGVLLLVSSVVNGLIKSFVKQGRPYWHDASLRLDDATSFSTPSGHAQTSAVLFGYLAWFLAGRRRGVLWVVILTLVIILVALSRVYLGVHYAGDILWGMAIGVALVALYAWLKPVLLPRLKQLPLGIHVLLALVVGTLIPIVDAFLLTVPFGSSGSFGVLYAQASSTTLDESVTVGGLAFGLWVGLAMENRYVRFSVAGPLWRRALRYVVGLAGLLAVWMGLRAILPQEPLWLGLVLQGCRYGLAALWAMLVWPWLFVKVGLAARESLGDSRSGDAGG
jgi:membrane-associated phospholipid phosphatase